MTSSASPSAPRTAILNVVGLTPRHIGPHTPFIQSFRDREATKLLHVTPLLPAVTSTMQATFLTGKPAGGHGIVANMWYDREYGEHRAWKQSDHLVQGKKLWETLREQFPDYSCAKVFWWNNMYSTANWQITPRPIYRSDGKKLFDIQTWPMDQREAIKSDLGAFPFHAFWGPASGIASSRWIARSAQWFEDKFSPHLNLVYLPHLDYNLQRLGPEDPTIAADLRDIDKVVGDLTKHLESRGVRVVILSEYGITQVDRPIHINRILREKGWLSWRDELGTEMLDPGNCRVLAIADHQVAHVYVNEADLLDEVRQTLLTIPGVTDVLDTEEQARLGIAHPRSGDFVVVSDEHSWFTYYWWLDDQRAPDFARCVDIHRKPGYDPVELFLDPQLPAPKLSVVWRLLKKALGFRMKMDVIPLDASLVKGSHGCIPVSQDDHPLLLGAFSQVENYSTISAVNTHEYLLSFCLGK